MGGRVPQLAKRESQQHPGKLSWAYGRIWRGQVGPERSGEDLQIPFPSDLAQVVQESKVGSGILLRDMTWPGGDYIPSQ